MKYIDNDMDELFNKAGRQYPLKTEPKNWEAVHNALLNEQGALLLPKKNYKRYYPFLFLLLLVPFFFIRDDRDIRHNAGNRDAEVIINANSEVKDKKGESPVTNEQEGLTKNKKANLRPEVRNDADYKKVESPVTDERNRLTKNNKGNILNPIIRNDADNKQLINTKKNTQSGNKQNYRERKTPHPLLHKEQVAGNVLNNIGGDEKRSDEVRGWTFYPPLASVNILFHEPSARITVKPPVKSLSRSDELKQLTNKKNKQDNYKQKFYYGLFAGPDLSTIKYQEIQNVGLNIGILVGYSFNKHWSVEAGGIWSRKKYYTEGKYFDKTGAQIPSYVNISYLDGGCEMFEFPIAVRYNFSTGKNSFFGTAGLTSYIMKKESYSYLAESSGNTYEGYRSYSNSGDHLFSNIQLSAGYNYRLFSGLNIRIEPYFKMPLKKIGIGKLPITSTGVYFGLIKDLK